MTSTIELRNVSKIFKIYDRPVDLMWETLLGRVRHRNFEALRDINLSIEKGSVVGLIGRNGAGKSTLLRIIAQTLQQSSGEVRVDGRISAILELGTGFNPDYTGRENIYLGGLCLGLTRQEVRALEAEIIAFSELEEFIDQPFKTYSSGMQARLTFGVAVSVEPDILIVDEALAVGDAKFQRKCFRKFEEFREAGVTILFVTHQTGIVEAICDRAVYLSGGKIIADGIPRDTVGQYLEDLFGGEKNVAAVASPPEEGAPIAVSDNIEPMESRRYGTGEVEISNCGIMDAAGRPANLCESGEAYSVFCEAQCHAEMVDDLQIGIGITTKTGVVLAAHNSSKHRIIMPALRKHDRLRVQLDIRMNLGPGEYFITFGAWSLFADKHYDRRVDVIHFTVRGDPKLELSLVNLFPRFSASKLTMSVKP